jgi:lipase chaperone LimK
LANWQPHAIAIEELSGLQCAYLRSNPKRFSEVVKTYCWDNSAAKAATGLDIAEANAQVEQLLRKH